MSFLQAAPPLPPTWPYAHRAPLERLETVDLRELPGLGPGWRVQSTQAIDLQGEPRGLDGAFGRGGVYRLGSTVVRPYRRGGLFGRVVARRYRHPSRFFHELAVHGALWEAGFPTVRPLGVAWRPAFPWGVEGVYFTQEAQGRPWPREWSADPTVLGQAWGAIEALCAWGLWAPDLNATNVLVAPEGSVLLLDWDRACWDSSPGLAGRYKRRLARSLAKLGAPAHLMSHLDRL